MARVLPDEYRSPPTDSVDIDVNRHLLCHVDECPTCTYLLSIQESSFRDESNPLLSSATTREASSVGERLSLVFAR